MNVFKFIACLLLITSCKHQNVNSTEHIPFETISIEESACEGDCPTYSMTFSHKGKAFYNGKFNVNEVGEKTYQFSKKEIDDLFQTISTIEFDKLNDEYDSGIADLPELVITVHEKRIVVKDLRMASKPLKDLVNKLQMLARSTGYIN